MENEENLAGREGKKENYGKGGKFSGKGREERKLAKKGEGKKMGEGE